MNAFLTEICNNFISNRDSYIKGLTDKVQIKNLERTILEGIPCYRRESFNELISHLQQVKRMDITGATIEVEDTIFTQEQVGGIKQKNVSYLFAPNTVPALLMRVLSRFAEAQKVRVKGVSNDGLEAVYDLRNNLEDFGSVDYDTIVKTMSEHPVKLIDFNVAQILLNKAQVSSFVNSDCE